MPGGFLSPPVWGCLDVVAVATLGACVLQARRTLPEEVARRMGILGAFVFAAQRVNVPVAAGTTRDLFGGALVAAMVGPAAAPS